MKLGIAEDSFYARDYAQHVTVTLLNLILVKQ